MAAWSDHEDSVVEPVMRRGEDTLVICSICDGRGCEFCPKASVVERVAEYTAPEEYPSELWGHFSDEDLERLIVDTRQELRRRYGHGCGRSPYPIVWQR
jgi:hypothetical protein